MSASKSLGLPPLPPQLKSISPFVQRAEEVKSQDPVIAYWCAYHAAQLGISLKAKDSGSRTFLFDLLGVLEHMKKEIGPNDALDVEAVSVAYVENFALKVFAVADIEDRKGDANRSTAKKFLAAANFFEVLKIFPKSDLSETHEEKIRYAKWKAADISKAIREGRKPIAGPAEAEISLEPSLPSESLPSADTPTARMSTQPRSPSPPRSIPPPSPPHVVRVSPPLGDEIEYYPNESQTPPRHAYLDVPRAAATPGSWSTAATPGTAHSPSRGGEWPSSDGWEESPLRERTPNWGNEGLSDIGEDRVHSTLVYEADREPTPDFLEREFHEVPSVQAVSDARRDSSDSVFGSSPSRLTRPVSPPTTLLPFTPPPPPPPLVSLQASGTSPPQRASMHFGHAYEHVHPPATPVALVDVPVELTPERITKAQKHARFAISALDYEDSEQAKKELRTALAILGGR